jgi:quercetin dioxygenase-like cupin family protein
MHRSKIISAAAALVFAGCLAFMSAPAGYTQAAAPVAKRTVLNRQDLSVPGREGVLVQTELEPGAKEPNHTHPGDLFAYVLQGTITLTQDGQPTVQKNVGESFFVPAGKVHAASNQGTANVKLLVTFFVEKGKPLTTPVK